MALHLDESSPGVWVILMEDGSPAIVDSEGRAQTFRAKRAVMEQFRALLERGEIVLPLTVEDVHRIQ